MRKIVHAMVPFLLLLSMLPTLFAEDDWSEAKTRVVDLGRKDYISPAYSPSLVSGDRLELPGKDGQGILVKVSNQKILVDKDQKGNPDFSAAQGQTSKPSLLIFITRMEKR
ncbi:MAG: hypothetical protein Kow00107_08310 [Planctomycetota bacterium]